MALGIFIKRTASVSKIDRINLFTIYLKPVASIFLMEN